jgi:hypothetical protein
MLPPSVAETKEQFSDGVDTAGSIHWKKLLLLKFQMNN